MAWSNIGTKTDAVDTFAAADINQLMENIRVISGNGTSAPPDDLTGLDARVTVCESVSAPSERDLYTRMMGGQHFDLIWKDADEVIIKPKHAQGLGAWIGVILNDNEYIEATADITVKYDTPANSGHILDGITAKLNNEWMTLWLYKASGGTLAAGLTWMANTTFSNNNPTNSLTVNQVNSQDIGYLFTPDAQVVVWNASAKFETPLYNTTDGYVPTTDLTVSSRTTTALTLSRTLGVSNFSANDKVYQVSGFKPLDVTTGSIASAISTRGYRDSGIRLRTDGSGNLYNFIIDGDRFYFANGTGSADYTAYQGLETIAPTTSYANYLLSFCPKDKSPFFASYTSGSGDYLFKRYYLTYSESFDYSEFGAYWTGIMDHSRALHSIMSVKMSAQATGYGFSTRGYVI